MKTLTPILKDSVENYVKMLQNLTNDHYAKNLSNLTPPTIKVSYGQAYAKVYVEDGASKSVHTFVALRDINTKEITALAGDVMMAAGWKAPAKHPRGSVYNTNPLEGVGVHGAKYLVGPNVA